MFFQCLGQAVYDLDYKSSLLDPNDMLFMTNETKIGKRGHWSFRVHRIPYSNTMHTCSVLSTHRVKYMAIKGDISTYYAIWLSTKI